jgi:hypothetical protein
VDAAREAQGGEVAAVADTIGKGAKFTRH